MKCDGYTEWTEKLQPTVLAANTQTKIQPATHHSISCLEETLIPLTF